jgi:hypothetical protein
MGSWLWALLGGLLAFAIVAPASYAGIKAWRRSELRSLETLADQLERVLADSPSTTSAAQMDRSSQAELGNVQMESPAPSDSSAPDTRPRRRDGGRS